MTRRLTDEQKKARKQENNRNYYERNKEKWVEYRRRREAGPKIETADPPLPIPAEA